MRTHAITSLRKFKRRLGESYILYTKDLMVKDDIRHTKLRDWDFTRREGGIDDAAAWADDVWEHVTVPHDWAIHGEFRRENDLQVTRASPFACRPWS